MKSILIPILFFVFITENLKAQLTNHNMFFIGYEYQKQGFGELGFRMLFLKKDDVLYRVGVSALLGETNKKFAAMPKLQGDLLFNFNKKTDIQHGLYYLIGIESTNKYLTPKIGISIFGTFDITAGYALPYGKTTLNGKKLDGFNFNVTLNIPFVMAHDLLKQ